MTNWPMQQQILVPTTPMYNDPGIHQPQMLVQTSNPSPIPPQAYSPSDVYVEDVYANYNEDNEGTQETHDELDSHNALAEGQKRLSAFQRLGPLTQPKKPKLTINLQLNKKESVREVVDLTDDSQTQEYVPVHLRQNIITSTDEIVMKYLILWPWKRTVGKRRSVTIRSSKSVMILEQEQMEEFYERDSQFIQVSITGYPSTWTKEMVLDTLLDRLKGLSFIPCFIEFTQEECKFLVIRSRVALVAIHKLCFTIRNDDVKLIITLSLINLTLKHIDFLPRLVLRKKLTMNYDGGDSLNFKAFTLQDDVSHFIYFPLSRSTNQSELIQLQSTITWQHIASLNLSYNKMTSIDSFNLSKVTPKLKHLDLSYNYLEKLTILLSIRDLPLHSIKVEGNPLCHDYIDPTHYVKVIRMMFPAIKEIDGIPIQLKGDLPAYKKIYCPEEVKPLVDKFLDVYFPLLEAQEEDRLAIKDLYEKNAMFTVIYKYKFIYRFFRKISHRNRFFDDGEKEVVEGASAIAKAVSSWPNMKYDPFSFSIDVVYHSDSTTVLRINGILKLTTESLADDEHIIAFAKTIALRTTDGAEYKISNELVLWDEPNVEHTKSAFQMTRVRAKQLNLKLEETPNDDLKAKLVEIFTQLTDLDSKASERCLDLKGWNIKAALEYFMQLLRLDDLGSLTN
ncbi:nuclear RNA export factor 2 [Aphomia sociella]